MGKWSLHDVWQFFRNIGNQKNEQGQILLKDSATKVIGVIDKVLVIANGADAAIIEGILSEEAQQSIENVKAEILIIREQLTAIVTLPDIATELKDYRFADNDATNDFYHNLVSTATIAFSDGQVSLFEAISFLVQVAVFIQNNK